MPDIRHRVGIFAPQQSVFDAVGTVDGLAQWWTRDVRGSAEQGGELGFYFGGDRAAATMRVAERVSPKRVLWECVDGAAEWVGTTVTFDVSPGPAEGETVLLFTHADWREPVEFMHHCSSRWAQYLISLKSGLEGAPFQPFPDTPGISSWN